MHCVEFNCSFIWGTVLIVFSDGTAKGGDKIGENGCEYLREEGVVQFKHRETSKVLHFHGVKEAKVQ